MGLGRMPIDGGSIARPMGWGGQFPGAYATWLLTGRPVGAAMGPLTLKWSACPRGATHAAEPGAEGRRAATNAWALRRPSL
jgi:hypothetical protein